MPSQDRFEARIDTQPIEQSLRQALAFVESDERRAIIDAYLGAARPFFDQAGYQMAALLAQALNDSAQNGLSARAEHRGDGVWLVVEAGEADPAMEQPYVEGDLEKVTLRLPKELKEAVDRLAGSQGMSANTWYIRGLARSIANAMRFGFEGGPPGPPGFGPDGPRPPRRNRRNSMRGFVGGEGGEQ